MNTALLIITVGLIGFNVFYFLRAYLKGKDQKKILNKFADYVKDWQLQLVYETQDGTKVYGYKNPVKMPANRALSAEIAANQASMKITSESLMQMIQAMEDAGNDGEIVELFGYLARLKQRLVWACEEQTLFNLSDCYLVLEGENPELVEPKWTERKREIINSDPLAKGFFLAYALRLTKDYGDISESDILNYLTMKETQEGTQA